MLICPECLKEVSPKAEICPHCGLAVNYLSKNKRLEKLVLDTPIEELDLSIRTYRILNRANVRFVRDLIHINKDNAVKLHLGKKSLEEIGKVLGDFGICFDHRDECYPLKKVVQKYDWNCERAATKIKYFTLNRQFSEKELNILKRGYLPESMEEKWFTYYENGVLNCYRSWTGRLVVRVLLNHTSDKHIVISYHDEDGSPEVTEENVLTLLDSFIRCPWLQ